MTREAINLSDSTQSVIVKMSEGNPGALTVLVDMLKTQDPTALMNILSLDDMNIRGSQIWVGYKDHCGSDMDKFIQAVKDRDADMVETINRECYHPEIDNDGYKHRAVTSGASFDSVAGQQPDVRGMGY